MWVRTFEDELINSDHIYRIHVEIPVTGTSALIAELSDSSRVYLYEGSAEDCLKYRNKLATHLVAYLFV